MIHLLARTQAVVPKPVAHGHRAEQEFAAGLVGADNAQSTCLETIDAIEGRFGEPQTLTALRGSRARAGGGRGLGLNDDVSAVHSR